MSRLLSLFGAGLVIADGAWGTEFQKRGLALGQPADLWNLTRPEDVEAVAQAYVDAGSQVILTNTFRSNPVALAAHGEADRAAEINRRGAELSRKAAGAKIRVFASMGPTGKVLATGEIDERTVTDAFKLQAEALAAGGADALLFETFSDVEEAPCRAGGEAAWATDPRLLRLRQRQEQGPDDDGSHSRGGRPRHGRSGCRRRRGQLRSGPRALPTDLPQAQGVFRAAGLDQAQRGNALARGRPGCLHHGSGRVCQPPCRIDRGRGELRRRLLRNESRVCPSTGEGCRVMRILLIGCEVIIRELCDAITRSPHVVDARFLSKGLHDLAAKAMRQGLQSAIDEVEARAETAWVDHPTSAGNTALREPPACFSWPPPDSEQILSNVLACTEHVELAANPRFQDSFVDCMGFPRV